MNCSTCGAELSAGEKLGDIQVYECEACGASTWATVSQFLVAPIEPGFLLVPKWRTARPSNAELHALRLLFPQFASVPLLTLRNTPPQTPLTPPLHEGEALRLKRAAERQGLQLSIVGWAGDAEDPNQG
jgi:hypothetical protein